MMNWNTVLLAPVLLMVGIMAGAADVAPPAPLLPVPTPEQLAWQKLEFGMFCHFSINTFYNQEWGDGSEDPARFNPTQFDAGEWVKVAKECGIGYLVITAKHHDGFNTYPTAYSDHSVKASPWQDGKGDVVKGVADACHELGIMFGFYLSPWDRHDPSYADSAKYDEHFRNQLRELLTNYGKVGEVWFDGAGGKGHVYDWDSYYKVIRKLQPHALIAICGPDIRWVGNESGLAPDTHWSVQERDGKKVWYPAECDVPIRKGQWFFHTDGEKNLKSLRQLLNIYYRSVGHGAVLLLNVSPDRRGLLPDADVARLREMWHVISETFKTNLAENKPATASNMRGNSDAFGPSKALDGNADTYWATDDGQTTGSVEVDLGAPVTFDRSMVQENIALGQRVEAFAIDAWDGHDWKEITNGTTIGYKRINQFDPVTASKVRLRIDKALACPTISHFGVYKAPE